MNNFGTLLAAVVLCFGFVVGEAGAQITQVTQNAASDTDPFWSPDGQTLAFTSDRSGVSAIWLMSWPTGEATALTEGEDFHPCWSPDGETIAFASLRDANEDVWIVSSDGGEPERVVDHFARDESVAWNHDGTELLIDSNRGGDWNIWRIPLNDEDPIRVTMYSGFDHAPAASPDGSRIAFISDRTGSWELWVMQVDGSNPVQLTFGGGEEIYPCWSPDAARIAYASNGSGNLDIWVIDAEGGQPTQLTFDQGNDCYPDWSLDGARIAFSSDRSGNNDIYVLDLEPDFTHLETSILPHFTFANDNWTTRLTLSNSSAEPQDITMAAYSDEGIFDTSVTVSLPAWGGLSSSVADIFPQLNATKGWLKMGAPSDTLSGIMTFTFLPTGGTSSLPLTGNAGTEMVFPMLENSSTWSSGFAITNVSRNMAVVQIHAHSLDGSKLETAQLNLAPGQKWVSMADQAFHSALPERIIAQVVADQKVTGFALAFSNGNTQIVAVPASFPGSSNQAWEYSESHGSSSQKHPPAVP